MSNLTCVLIDVKVTNDILRDIEPTGELYVITKFKLDSAVQHLRFAACNLQNIIEDLGGMLDKETEAKRWKEIHNLLG